MGDQTYLEEGLIKLFSSHTGLQYFWTGFLWDNYSATVVNPVSARWLLQEEDRFRAPC